MSYNAFGVWCYFVFLMIRGWCLIWCYSICLLTGGVCLIMFFGVWCDDMFLLIRGGCLITFLVCVVFCYILAD